MQWQPKWYPFWVSMVSLFAGWHVMASLPINPNGTVQQLSKQLRYAINVKECKDLNLFKPKNVIFCPWGYVKKLWKHKIRHIYESPFHGFLISGIQNSAYIKMHRMPVETLVRTLTQHHRATYWLKKYFLYPFTAHREKTFLEVSMFVLYSVPLSRSNENNFQRAYFTINKMYVYNICSCSISQFWSY